MTLIADNSFLDESDKKSDLEVSLVVAGQQFDW
jgi:hypothetical protein